MFVVNPAAGSGRAKRVWPEFENALSIHYETRFTDGSGHATELTKRALQDGIDTVVAVGGDGTLNEVLNGFFEDGELINPDARLGMIPLGTGSDWARSSKRPAPEPATVDGWLQGSGRACDVGRVICVDGQGRKVTRYFLNVADAGFGAEVAATTNRASKALGPHVAYLSGLLKTLVRFKARTMRLTADDTTREMTSVLVAAVAIGRYFGGGMQIAPEARLDDGLFDVVVIEGMTKPEIVFNLPRLYNGRILEHPKVTCLRGQQVRIESDVATRLEVDGEQPGWLPATFTVLPQALNVIY